MENSKIEWTDHTANLWWGCQKVHAGCDNCYAEALDHRFSGDHWGAKAPRKLVKSVWKDLARFQRDAAAKNEIKRVFVGSMMDIFEVSKPVVDSAGNITDTETGNLRHKFFTEVVPNSPNLLFLLLTKRPGNISRMIPEDWKVNPPGNVMYGTSVVDMKTADKMINKLVKVPGKHFLSIEPLLAPLSLWRWIGYHGHPANNDEATKAVFRAAVAKFGRPIDWVIVGGESGPNSRPMHPDWVRRLRDECKAADVPFFFKQWGEYLPYEADAQPPFYKRSDTGEIFDGHGMNFIDPETGEAGKWNGATWYDVFDAEFFNELHGNDPCIFHMVGKNAAGRMIDGKIYNELPLLTLA
jgi:protein gp37